MKTIISSILVLMLVNFAEAQTRIQGKIFDLQTKEPLAGVNVLLAGTTTGTTTNTQGYFTLDNMTRSSEVVVSSIGYETQTLSITDKVDINIALNPAVSNLQPVVVTANREASLRTESPVAISKLAPAIIHETKPVLLTELINKIPGVVMLNYNNEQHGMAIRQPMSLSSYFLYMEDGIPLRPMGVFNHNALIEMNVFAISSIEVVKGPASSLYGPEAVGGAINFITHKPTAIPTARLGVQGDNWGYKRIQYSGGGIIAKKLGVYIAGFEARQRNAWQTYSDYDKSAFNARLDYTLSNSTSLNFQYAINDYYSDMAGSVDSISFYNRSYSSTTDFTYREVSAQRMRLTAQHQWSANSESSISVFYRDNYIKQNPTYSIRWKQGTDAATGEINKNSFESFGAIAQHSQKFSFLQSRLLAGASIDHSPTTYWAYATQLQAITRADGKSVERYNVIAEQPENFISRYNADLYNSAVYSQFDFTPIRAMRITLGARYDRMSFQYTNDLDQSSGTRTYQQFTPKAGITYELSNGKGVYANYSQGFAPPGLTAIFRKRPGTTNEFYYNLEPAQFHNYEVGGWAALLGNKVYADIAVYQMNGQRELINIRQPDNSFDYQSAGKTLHRGIEYGVTYKPSSSWFIRAGGTNAIHRFEEFIISERAQDNFKNASGKDMPQAPRWIANAEVTYKPAFVKGLRVALEWQRISSWYQNQVNTVKYDDRTFLNLRGVSYLNLRTGYEWKNIEVFVNITNLTDELYANGATRGNGINDRTTFTPAAPRTINGGIQYNFAATKKQ